MNFNNPNAPYYNTPIPYPYIHYQPPPPLQTGHGPLGHATPQIGPNGLYLPPSPPPPSDHPHDAADYIRLNPAEAAAYDALWTEASAVAGPDRPVAGPDARAIFLRAPRVSTTQLRLIWSIADHRADGALTRIQFFIALRLIALAQRGAQISIPGLRNFVGINCVPEIPPPPDAPPPPPPPPVAADHEQDHRRIHWAVGADVIARYDSFFASLDPARTGFVDGNVGAPFLAKSHLPRPVLKRVWHLADVTRDGKLDVDEFRQAMHMVALLRTGAVGADDLPDTLQPTGVTWVRTFEDMAHVTAAEHSLAPQPNQPPSPRTPPMAPLQRAALPGATDRHLLGAGAPTIPAAANHSPPTSPVQHQHQQQSSGGDHQLREKLAREQQQAARANHELSAVNPQMEKLRLQQAAARHPAADEADVDKMRPSYAEMAAAKAKADHHAAQARHEAAKLNHLAITPAVADDKSPTTSSHGRRTAHRAGGDDNIWTESAPKPKPKRPSHHSSPRKQRSPPHAVHSSASLVDAEPDAPSAPRPVSPLPPAHVPATAVAKQAPSPPRAAPPALPAPPAGARLVRDDDSDSDSDDDDFWGGSGASAKPTLVQANPANPGAANDLDEWAF